MKYYALVFIYQRIDAERRTGCVRSEVDNEIAKDHKETLRASMINLAQKSVSVSPGTVINPLYFCIHDVMEITKAEYNRA